MAYKVIAALLLCAAQAQHDHAHSKHALLSTVDDVVKSSLEFQVVFQSCVDSISPDMFSITGATASNGRCVERSTNQRFTCKFDVTGAGDEIHVILPEGYITDMEGHRYTHESNTLTVHHYSAIQARLYSTGTPANSPIAIADEDGDVEFKWEVLSEHPVFWNGLPPFTAAVDGSQLEIRSTLIEEDAWYFVVRPRCNGCIIQATISGGVARDAANHLNEMISISREVADEDFDVEVLATPQPTDAPETPDPTVGLETPQPTEAPVDCVVSAWTPYSPCSASCTYFTSTFERVGGERTRTRDIVTPASAGGAPCPTLTQTSNCGGALCSLERGSRPYSAETGAECASCAVTEPFSGAAVGDGRDAMREEAGCYCDSACDSSGDCCQGYYENECGSTSTSYPEYLSGWSPLVCSSSDCFSSSLKTDPVNPSYKCSCAASCVVDHMCCSGSESRTSICL